MFFKGIVIFGLLAVGCLRQNQIPDTEIPTQKIEEEKVEGWTQREDLWYFYEDGEMVTGWKKVDGVWYYLNVNGEMVTGWNKIDGAWYFLNASGEMATGWNKIDGAWYFLNASGEMATGWKKVDGVWYYLNNSGAMLTGWQQVGEKWYYLSSSGAMLKNQVVQGYVLDSNGEWMVDSDYIAANGSPYYIRVNKKACVVTVYTLDENGYYTVPLKSMICSTGEGTPTGTFRTKNKYRWRDLVGNVKGQYSTRIVNRILFHSVPYYSNNENDLEGDEFNLLGEIKSAGCVRLQVEDAKWIYDFCPLNTIVQIYENDMPGPFGIPDYIKIPTTGIFSHWDPTDPHQNNPWKQLSDGWNYIEGNWYYRYEDGSIAVNTMIDGYAVGQDGAWIS
ncbi:MAG: L,D-transpeptidase family protein [Lachnospiraceae bacterium]|nr:L,D-transpeptidase family protein [Lachnospiraceae bacterium]